MANHDFSTKLEEWLSSNKSKTLGSLDATFGRKSFAVAFFILMTPSALPIPTGGITNVLEIITLILAVELLFGRRSIWLPEQWRHRKIGGFVTDKGLPKLIKFLKFVERYSRPRIIKMPQSRKFYSLLSVFIILFVFGALVAPIFSGLDTMPSMGILLVSLSILLDDILIGVLGIVVGLGGVALELSLASFILSHARSIFR